MPKPQNYYDGTCNSFCVLSHPGVKSINLVPWMQYCDNPSEWRVISYKESMLWNYNETCESLL